MAKIADEHQGASTTVEYKDFSGGLNTTQNPELIAANELAKAINVEIDSTSGSLKTVAGTDVVLTKVQASGVVFTTIMHDSIGGRLLVVDSDRKVYAFPINSPAEITQVGTIDGTGTIEYTPWEDGIVITSGGRLQYFHGGTLETIANSFSTDSSYWTQVNPAAWATNHAYKVYDVVTYKGEKYSCTADHTSSSGQDTTYQARNLYYDSQYWELVYFRSWDYSTSYNINDSVQYGGKVYYCNKPHTSTARTTEVSNTFYTDSQYWEYCCTVREYEYDEDGYRCWNAPNTWQYNTKYESTHTAGWSRSGLVTYDGKVYSCKQTHTSCKPTSTITNSFETDMSKYWIEFGTNAWANGTMYAVGALVSFNGRIYRCTTSHTSCTATAAQTITGLTESDSANWAKLSADQWTYSKTYESNTFCYNGNTLYRCNSFHTSCGKAPDTCHAPFIKDGRVYVAIGDELHCSGIGDERNWTVNDNDASASQWLQIGYKDGGKIVGLGALASDMVIFKDNNRAYHLAGQYPNWQLSEIGRQIDCKGFNSCVSLADQVLTLGATALQTIRVTDQYGDMRSANVSAKVQKDIAQMGSIKLRYIPSLNQVWMINGVSRFFFVDMNNGGFFQREYFSNIYDVVEADNNVYVLKADKVCKLNSRHMVDDGAYLRWKIQGKTATTINQFLVKRSWVDTIPLFDNYIESLFLVDKVSLLGVVPWYSQYIYHDLTPICHNLRKVRISNESPLFINSDVVYANPDYIYHSDTYIRAKDTMYRAYLRQISRGKAIKLQGRGAGGPLLICNISYNVAEV